MSASAPVPQATAPPSSYGMSSYIPASSITNTMAAGYQNPSSSPNSGQLNAAGQSYYAGNGQQTVANTNKSTCAIIPSGTSGTGGQVQGAQTQGTTGGGDTQGTIDYNSMIQPALDALNGVANAAQSAATNNISDINAAQTVGQGQLNTALSGQQANINQSRASQQSLSQNAIQQAKQAYSEIGQGIQARYGGSTGTGAFATELAGRQTSTNMAQINTNLTQSMAALDNTWQQVQATHDDNLKALTQQTNAAIDQVKNTLSTNLANIGTQQGMLQSQKAELIAQAVQNYQSTVNSINTANQQFAQTLAANLASAGQSVQQAIATAKAIVGSGTSTAAGYGAQTQGISQTTPLAAQTAAAALPIGYWVDAQGQVHQGAQT
jgi:hypothetical protein